MLVLAREIEALAAAVAAVQDLDPVGLGTSSSNNLEKLLELEQRLASVTTRVLAAVDDAAVTVEETGRLTRSWLVEEQHLGPRTATDRLCLARGLPSCADADKAFAAGEINTEHALLIVRTVTKLPEDLRGIVDTALTDLCRQLPAYEVARMIDEILASLGLIADEDERFRRR